MQQTGAGGRDWLAIWREMRDAEHAQTASYAQMQQGADNWIGKARRFAQAHDRAPQPDAFMRFVLSQLQPSDTVLDIGAGAGRHALYLTQHAAQVVAVEPSPSMRAQLEVRRADVTNLTLIAGNWPDVHVEQCDIAICSHVLYGVREIEPFLTAMNQSARRACFILLGMQQPSFTLAPFWERIHGQTRHPLPGAIECLNVLHQLGIPANLTLVPASYFIFAGREESVEDLRWRLMLQEDVLDDAALLSLVDELLIRDDAGRLAPRAQHGYAGVVWWAPDKAA